MLSSLATNNKLKLFLILSNNLVILFILYTLYGESIYNILAEKSLPVLRLKPAYFLFVLSLIVITELSTLSKRAGAKLLTYDNLLNITLAVASAVTSFIVAGGVYRILEPRYGSLAGVMAFVAVFILLWVLLGMWVVGLYMRAKITSAGM